MNKISYGYYSKTMVDFSKVYSIKVHAENVNENIQKQYKNTFI